tara:strand:+ start:845 stop:1108 length:264 start_codon:yes stop_codon:yes gene_type:complete
MAKASIEVNKILDYVNNALADNPGELTEMKSGMCTMLFRILSDTGNYEGFQFLRNYDSREPIEAPHVSDSDYYDRIYYRSKKLTNSK